MIPYKIVKNKVIIGENEFSTSLVFPTARRALEGYMVKVPKKYKEFLSNKSVYKVFLLYIDEMYSEQWPYVCSKDNKQGFLKEGEK